MIRIETIIGIVWSVSGFFLGFLAGAWFVITRSKQALSREAKKSSLRVRLIQLIDEANEDELTAIELIHTHLKSASHANLKPFNIALNNLCYDYLKKTNE